MLLRQRSDHITLSSLSGSQLSGGTPRLLWSQSLRDSLMSTAAHHKTLGSLFAVVWLSRLRSATRCILAFAVLAINSTRAEVPTVDYLFPAGGKLGAKVQVTAGGKLDPWPIQVWTDCPELTFKAEETKGKLIVEIATNAPVGPHLVRFYNRDGASSVRCFIVGQAAEQLENEPNDDPKKAQPVDKTPVTINGRLEKSGDTDSFALNLKEGQWLVAGVDAYSIDSPMDPTLHLLDQQGTKLAFNHDGFKLDPLLSYHVEKTGTYILQLSAFAYPPKADVRLTGSESSVYRMTLRSGPYARYAFPAGIQRGTKATLRLFGWNLGTTGQAIVHQLDGSILGPRVDQILVAAPGFENCLRIPVGDAPEELEVEPNGTSDLAQPLRVPCTMNGQVNPAGDEDRYLLTAKKDEKFLIRVKSAALEFPLDAVVRLEDQKGSQLARSDDQGKLEDPELSWTAPADGSYVLIVGDLIQRGGPDYVYRLSIIHPAPDFKAALDNQAFKLEPGKTADMKVNVSRANEFRDSLIVVVEGLPDGVTSTAGSVPVKGGDVTITLSAKADAKPANLPIRVLALSTNPDAPRVRIAMASLKGTNSALGDLQINETDSVWLTVIPKPEPVPPKEVKPEPKKD